MSAVLATAPLLTLLMSIAGRSIWPERIMSEELDLAAVGGAVLVVAGSAMAALGGRRKCQ